MIVSWGLDLVLGLCVSWWGVICFMFGGGVGVGLFFLVISICTELLCFGRGFLIEYSFIIKRPIRDAYLFSPKFD